MRGDPTTKHSLRTILVSMGLVLGAACSSAPGTPTVEPEAPVPVSYPPAGLHRLTVFEYRTQIQQLLGPVAAPLDPDADVVVQGFGSVGASQVAVGPRAAELYASSAQTAAAEVFSDIARRTALVGCDASTAECRRHFIAEFADKAFRDATDEVQRTRWAEAVEAAVSRLGDPWSALQETVAAMLQSPTFLFRADVGVPHASGSASTPRRRYVGSEMASRLANLFTGGLPDQQLRQAARSGELDTPAGVRSHAERLSIGSGYRTRMLDFFSEHLRLGRLDQLRKDKITYPLWTPALASALREQVLRTIDAEIVTPDADVRTLFTTPRTYVNDDLARLYHVRGRFDAEFIAVELPASGPRAGLLGMGAVLALQAHERFTSPTLRGKFIRSQLLCRAVPPPPPGINARLDPSASGSETTTLRQRLESEHLQRKDCAACHSLVDPLGFGLEHFDAIGQYRTTDAGLPVDAHGGLDGASFADARGLGRALAEHPNVGPCLTRTIYRWATGHLETEGEESQLRTLSESFASSGYRLRPLLVALAASDAFRYADPPAEATSNSAEP